MAGLLSSYFGFRERATDLATETRGAPPPPLSRRGPALDRDGPRQQLSVRDRDGHGAQRGRGVRAGREPWTHLAAGDDGRIPRGPGHHSARADALSRGGDGRGP